MATGYLGTSGSSTYFNNGPISLGVTMPANTYPNGTITFDNIGQTTCWFHNGHVDAQVLTLYLCDSAGNNEKKLCDLTIPGNTSVWTMPAMSISGATGLAAKALYIKATGTTLALARCFIRNRTAITIPTASLKFAITCNAGTGGSLSANKSTAAAGETVTLTPTANTGYQFSSYTTSPTLTITSNQFTMPAQAVTITANFTKRSYAITCSAGTGGTLTASKSTANYGDTITLTPKANTGYQFSGYTTSPTVTITNNSFTMPASAITVTATFTKKSYAITCSAGTGGSLTANKATATMGETITLTATPNTGYKLDSISTSPTVTVSSNSFTMPASAITITATFSKRSYTITKAVNPSGAGSVTVASSGTYGSQISVSQTPAAGYEFVEWQTSPALTISGGKFTMPAQAVTITAKYQKKSYSITKKVSPTGAGTVTAPSSATYGNSVSISQTPATGYYFKEWQTSPALTISGGSFTMPAQAVTVTAKYLKRSTASLNKTTLTGGGTATLTITTESSAYTHKYKLSFGTNMETSKVSVAAGTTSVSISIPESWSNYIPNATSKSGGTLLLETYSGSTKIGEYTITGLVYAVPSSAKPTIGTITTSIARTIGGKTYANVGSYYVQKHSGVRIQTSATTQLSATISSVKAELVGYSGGSYVSTVSAASIDFTTGLLLQAGTATIKITATDSRGRTATKTKEITVTAYNAPDGVLTVKRADVNGDDDDMGTYGKFTLSKAYSAVGSNTLTVTMTSQGSSQTITGTSGNILPGSRQTFSIQYDYTIKVTLVDAFETVTLTTKLRSAKFIIYANAAGNKLGFMKAANKSIPTGKNATIEFSADAQVYLGDDKLDLPVLQQAFAIIANGDTHAAITNGDYVYVKNNTHSLADGLYKATANVAANGSVSSSNMSALSTGGMNEIKGQMAYKADGTKFSITGGTSKTFTMENNSRITLICSSAYTSHAGIVNMSCSSTGTAEYYKLSGMTGVTITNSGASVTISATNGINGTAIIHAGSVTIA